jgi:hypothetical protein
MSARSEAKRSTVEPAKSRAETVSTSLAIASRQSATSCTALIGSATRKVTVAWRTCTRFSPTSTRRMVSRNGFVITRPGPFTAFGTPRR